MSLLLRSVSSASVASSFRRRGLARTVANTNVSFSRVCSMSTSAGVFDKIAFLGAGKMAQAMLIPVVNTGLQPASNVAVYDVSQKAVEHVRSAHPEITHARSVAELVEGADLVVCAVKPQNLDSKFFEQISNSNFREDATLLSIIAGKPVSSYLEGSPKILKVARTMPNTPAQIGKGITVWCATPNIETEERGRIKKVLDCFGKTVFVEDESFIDMSTSISGSGPAYIFMLMEAMVDAGVHMGFSRDTATTLVHHTLLGSTLYAMENKTHPAILRNSVTSPAGTTASAMYELENGKFRTVIKDAIWACYRRSLEMGGHDSNVGPGRQTIQHHFIEAPHGEMDSDQEEEKGK